MGANLAVNDDVVRMCGAQKPGGRGGCHEWFLIVVEQGVDSTWVHVICSTGVCEALSLRAVFLCCNSCEPLTEKQ